MTFVVRFYGDVINNLPPGGSLANVTVVLPDQGTTSVAMTAGVPSNWEVRIDNPLDLPNTPNNDPGLPEPIDDAWQLIPGAAGQSTVFFAVNEEWAQSLNPDAQGTPTETFRLYVRATPTAGGSAQTAILTVEV